MPCARNKSLCLTHQSSTALRGIPSSNLTSQRDLAADSSFCSCRRRDSIPTPKTANPDFATPFQKFGYSGSTMHGCHSTSLPDLLPRLQPTTVNGLRSARIPPQFHEGTADLDPTEWKPSETLAEVDVDPPPKTGASSPTSDSGGISLFGGSSSSLAGSWKPKLVHRPSSEASNFLGQFHRSSDSLTCIKRRSTRAANSLISRATPGLSHSPTVSSTGSEESLGGTPYELVMRPRSTSRPTIAVSMSSAQVGSTEVSYQKQSVPTIIDPTNPRSASGSLKDLLTGGKKPGSII